MFKMINYDLTKIKALAFDIDGVLSANVVSIEADGLPVRTVSIKDGYALHIACVMKIPMAIITGGNAPNVRRRYINLGFDPEDIYLPSSVKMVDYVKFRDRHGLRDEEILFVGDDIPDLPVLKVCGLPCCPSDAAPEVKAVAKYISPAPGGHGVARDIVEQFLKANGLWMKDEEVYSCW